MEDRFIVIAITPEVPLPEEGKWIENLLETGEAQRVHLRHPAITVHEMKALLNTIDVRYFNRISLHDYPELVTDTLGFHFNNRVPYTKIDGTGKRSMSLHSSECMTLPALDYVTLSPVFDSFSKQGYKANPNLDPARLSLPVIALGGVTPDRFDELRRRGFAGGAMLGYFANMYPEKII